jgi:hypothetical protein
MLMLTRCETCGGFTGTVPENYEGPALSACFCNRERHIEEELGRAGAPNSDTLNVFVTEVTKAGDKVG